MNGYDLDGVITKGIKPKRRDVIITGRSYEEAAETYSYLFRSGIFNAVYFNPVPFDEKTLENSAKWKAQMSQRLLVNIFFEDDERQAKIMREVLENVKISVRLVG
jgi:hypothetical protein